jgi:hypothetical protein
MPNFINRYNYKNYNPLNRQRMTDAERDLLPYVQGEKAKKERESNWLQPLELVMDLLSRGQYVTANLGEDVTRLVSGEAVNPLEGILKGLTGERKGTWKGTLFGGQDPGELGKFQGIYKSVTGSDTPEFMRNKVDIPIIGPTNIEDVIGFIGDVLLDPTTYISGGSTKVAKSVAGDFAQRSVKLAIKNLDDIGDMAKLYQKGLDKDKLLKLITANKDDAAKRYIAKYDLKNGGIARYLDKVYRQSYDKALRSTPDQLKAELIESIKKGQETVSNKLWPTEAEKLTGIPFMDELRKTSGSPEKFAKSLTGGQEAADLFEKFKSFEGEMAGLEGVNWTGAGESALNLFGKEAFTKFRGDTPISKSWNTFKQSIQNSKIGGIYDDAVWSITNRGPIGFLRKAFGFRNPYQTMLNIKKNAATNEFQWLAEQKVKQVQSILEGYDDTIREKVRNVIAQAEFKNIGLADLFNNSQALKALGVDEKEFAKVKFLSDQIQTYFKTLRKEEEELVQQGLLKSFGEFANYLPSVKNKKDYFNAKPGSITGSRAPRFTKEKNYLTLETINQEIEKLSVLLGIDKETAEILVTKKNWSTFNLDLEEMLLHRSIAHAQAVANGNMLKQFREFGISFDDISQEILKDNPHIIEALTRADADLSELGLYREKVPGLEKYWFDKDVADIVNRVIPVTNNDEGVNWFLERARAFSSWWKGMATLTPGFHLRNAQSNNTQLFLKFGPRAFNPKQSMDALVGTAYALYGEEIFNTLKLPKARVAEILNKPIGGKTIKELATEARKSGIISKNIMGFDVETTVKELTKSKKGLALANIFSQDNIAFKGSREIGSVIESTPKFQSMLMDLQDMAARVGDISQNHIDFAVMDAKKWFFDYSDLTEFEQKYMKAAIPFYTWLRKNISLQMTNIFRLKSNVRSMYSTAFKVQGAIEEDYDRSQVPDWLREGGAMVTGQEDGTVRTLQSLPGISFPGPMADINKLPLRFEMTETGIPMPVWTPEEIRDEILSSANPLIKSIVNVYLRQDEGWDSFKKRALKDTETAPRVLSLFLDKPVVMQFVDGLMRVAGFEDGLQAERGEKGELKIDGKVKQVLEDNFIIIQRLDNLLDTATTFIPQLETWLENNVGYKDTTEDMDKFFKTMSFLVGVKQKDFFKDQEDAIRIREIMEKAQEKRNKALKKTPGYRERQAKYEKSYQRKIRRLGL